MIQRIQTVFLLLAAICSGCLLFFPFATNTKTVDACYLSPFSRGCYCNSWELFAGYYNLGMVLGAVILIFFFKNRVLQFQLAIILAVLNTCLAGIILFVFINFNGYPVEVHWPAFLPFASAFFIFLAGRYIKKDENLVRSADRIR